VSLEFSTDNPAIDQLWRRALDGLARNAITVAGHHVLTVAPGYPGIWLEHAPHEGLLYADIDPRVAVANHALFLATQRGDGQMCCYHLMDGHGWPDSIPQIGFGQVQSVVSLCLTGAELCQRTGDLDLAERLYTAGIRWDAWFALHRDSDGLGLVQAFCAFDTGHDNSRRFGLHPEAVPDGCPGADATRCNAGHDLPWYAPDMSASRIELRQGIARLARLLGRLDQEQAWSARATASSQALRRHLFDAEDAFFYDRDRHGGLRRFRTEAAFHPLRAGVLSPGDFERMWNRHLGNPARFWPHTPLPSVALDDPAFDAGMPANSWSGASQSLTVLRAPLWMERYGRFAELAALLARWRDLLASSGEFHQEADPSTGRLQSHRNYSGSLFVAVEAINRLHGVHRHVDGTLAWNCRLPPAASRCSYRLDAPDTGRAELHQERGISTLVLDGRVVATAAGAGRISTDRNGAVVAAEATAGVALRINGQDVPFDARGRWRT
jgi:hypothetical protein